MALKTTAWVTDTNVSFAAIFKGKTQLKHLISDNYGFSMG